METQKIAFIGAGNMATALISGLISDGFDPKKLWASDPEDKHLNYLEQEFKINTCCDNKVAVNNSDIVVLCIKPQIMKNICEEIADAVSTYQSTVVSIAAGIRVENLGKWLGEKTPLVRAMPNTPALIKTGATGLYANNFVEDSKKSIAEKIMRAVGVVLWLDQEKEMDYVTALSGSGPAYFFRIMEAMEKSAIELGLSTEAAHVLTLQTALGASKLAMESSESLETLREKVTSPGGTTEKGLAVMEDMKIEKIIQETLSAASIRAEELAKEFGDK